MAPHSIDTDEIIRAFNLFDEGGKGKITLQDLRRVARELGEGLQEDELVSMMEEFDMDGDQAISRDDYQYLLGVMSIFFRSISYILLLGGMRNVT
jgi:Ca2+-binding EF-hand superfamily protein